MCAESETQNKIPEPWHPGKPRPMDLKKPSVLKVWNHMYREEGHSSPFWLASQNSWSPQGGVGDLTSHTKEKNVSTPSPNAGDGGDELSSRPLDKRLGMGLWGLKFTLAGECIICVSLCGAGRLDNIPLAEQAPGIGNANIIVQPLTVTNCLVGSAVLEDDFCHAKSKHFMNCSCNSDRNRKPRRTTPIEIVLLYHQVCLKYHALMYYLP